MVTATTDEVHETKELFALLRFLFWQEPTRELLENFLQAEEVQEENDIDRGLNLMQRAVRKNQDRLDEYTEELAVEFARLFLGPQKPVAIPFASFYLSENRQLMSDVTIDVRKKYLDAGMAVKDLHSIPDDHISMELEFLAWLAGEAETTLEQGDNEKASSLQEAIRTFLADHVRPWAPTFAQNIVDNTHEDFYKGMALVLKGVL